MKTVIKSGLCVLLCYCIFVFTGCKKKSDQGTPAPQPPAESVETKPAAGNIETISLADVKNEISKLNIEQLKEKAIEYKNAIVSKKAEIEKVAEKLKAIPLTEQMGSEAKALQDEVATLNKAVTALTERFQVYYNKLKEMGGDTSGLSI